MREDKITRQQHEQGNQRQNQHPQDKGRRSAFRCEHSQQNVDAGTEPPIDELAGCAAELRVNALTTFSLRWLLPRLAQFRDRHPESEVRLSTSTEPVDALSETYGLIIRGGPDKFYGFTCYPFLTERRLPVCTAKKAAAPMKASPAKAALQATVALKHLAAALTQDHEQAEDTRQLPQPTK